MPLRTLHRASTGWKAFLLLVCGTGIALGQPPVHYQHRADMPPGFIGQQQLMRGGPLAGYFQPVELKSPEGSLISLAVDGGFAQPQKESSLAGMQIGYVYRFKVGNIPGHEGEEVFPTIEVVDRLYPPPGQATRFPIPIELTQEELELALDGRYVTRVIYVEDPNAALAEREIPGKQRYFEIGAGQDPLKVADELGRPVAILRMGSRIPDGLLPDGRFLYDSPPLIQYESPAANVPRNQGVEKPLEAPRDSNGRESRTFKRLPERELRR